jgi:YegS/Rv2252/BmrU family lipid kinase
MASTARTNLPEKNLPPPIGGPELRGVGVFANPIAGRGKSREIAQSLWRRLDANHIPATILFDPPAETRSEQLRELDAAIVIGGDGTLRAVAARFLREFGSVPPLLAIPMGTANLLNRHLHVDWEAGNVARRVIASIRRWKLLPIDAARANGELFLLMAGVGIDGWIIHELDRIRTGPINYASYIVPAMMALAAYEYTPITVDLDGQRIFDSAPAMAFVGNISEYGTGFPILPNAVPDDGLLDICVIPARSRGHAIKQFLRAAAGEHLQAEGVVYARGKKIRVESPRPVPVQIDGDPAGHTPVEIDLLPIQVRFIVPIENRVAP